MNHCPLGKTTAVSVFEKLFQLINICKKSLAIVTTVTKYTFEMESIQRGTSFAPDISRVLSELSLKSEPVKLEMLPEGLSGCI